MAASKDKAGIGAWAGIGAASYSVITAIVAVCIAYSSIPYWDGWDFWRMHDELIRSPIRLFSQHNEHRIAALRLFLLADLHVFAGQGHWLVACIMAALFSSALIVWRMASKGLNIPRSYSMFLLGSLVSILFSLQQFDNFIWTFQIGFVLAYTGSLGALASLHTSAVSESRGRAALWFALALIAGWSATYSLASGLFVWVLLVSLALFLRLRGVRLILVLVCAAVTIATYMYGYSTPGHHGKPLEALMQPHKLAVYAFAYLGLPADELASYIASRFGGLSDNTRIAISALAGVGIFVVAARAALIAFVHSSVMPSRWLVLMHMMVFVLASAGVTALGRMSLSMAGVLTSRYSTPAVLFWACTVALAAVTAFATRPALSEQRLTTRWVLLALVLLIFLPGQIGRIGYARQYRALYSDARNSLAVGVYDAAAWQKLYHTHHAIIRRVGEMRKNRLSAFAGPLAQLVGQRAADRFPDYASASAAVSPPAADGWNHGACFANVDRSQPVDSSLLPGHRFDGWAWDVAGGRAPDVLLVDRSGTIRGFASPEIPRGDVDAAVPGVTDETVGWVGYAAGGYGSTISAFALLSNGSLCKFGTVQVQDVLPQLPPEKIAGPLPVPASLNGSWQINGDHYLSESSTARSGVLEMGPFSTASAQSIAIPVQTGPAARGQSIDVFDADTGMLLSTFRPAQGFMEWRSWRIDLLGMENLRLRVVATDAGTGDGEYLRLRTPHAVRP